MTTWFTADLHFGHANIIRYCDRPFSDAQQMNEAMIDNWNERVGPNDTVFVVGDFALGTIADTLPLAAALAGHKVLIAGNHDRCFRDLSQKADVKSAQMKVRNWEQRYLEAGFDRIIHDRTTVQIGDVTALVCHFPYAGDVSHDERYVSARPTDNGEWLIHGHIHEKWLQSKRMINVGVDVWGFRPVAETEIAALIAAGPRELEGPHKSPEQPDAA